MYEASGLGLAADTNRPVPRKTVREAKVRKARARKILERRRDRQQLRKHIEEIWN